MNNPFEELASKIDALESKIDALFTALKVEPTPEVIDTLELCKRLRISRPTVRRLMVTKKLPYFRLGSQVRYNWLAVVKAFKISVQQ